MTKRKIEKNKNRKSHFLIKKNVTNLRVLHFVDESENFCPSSRDFAQWAEAVRDGEFRVRREMCCTFAHKTSSMVLFRSWANNFRSIKNWRGGGFHQQTDSVLLLMLTYTVLLHVMRIKASKYLHRK